MRRLLASSLSQDQLNTQKEILTLFAQLDASFKINVHVHIFEFSCMHQLIEELITTSMYNINVQHQCTPSVYNISVQH